MTSGMYLVHTLQISEKEEPRHHWTTASISSTLNDWTYSSSSISSLHSFDTLAIRRAISCITRRGAASSSFNFVGCSLFSVNTKQLRRAAQCSGANGLNTPLKTNSVSSNSSPELISHATLPLTSTMSAEVVNPNRRRTRLRHLSSSSLRMSCVAWMLFLRLRIRS